jgi:hypothetical protein
MIRNFGRSGQEPDLSEPQRQELTAEGETNVRVGAVRVGLAGPIDADFANEVLNRRACDFDLARSF